MKKFIHLGYPKNFSTSLQRDFFAAHDEIHHLGIGIGSNIGYIDPVCSSLFEVFLKFSKSFHYRTHVSDLKKHIQHHLYQARIHKKKCMTASSEHLAFSFLHESIDFPTKLTRLVKLFGEDVNVILILRNQMELIHSMYNESVRTGLKYSYAEYLKNLWQFQDRNFMFDFRYDMILLELYKKLPKENIHVFFFEEYAEGQTHILKKSLAHIMGISEEPNPLKHLNPKLSSCQLKTKLELNQRFQHDFGNELFESAEIHRQAEYFNTYLKLNTNPQGLDFFHDVKTKQRLIAAAKVDYSRYESTSGMDYNSGGSAQTKIQSFFAEGNKILKELIDFDMPAHYTKIGP